MLGVHVVLHEWLPVFLKGFLYDIPADEVIPACPFESKLAWALYILEVFEDGLFAHAFRKCRNMYSVTDLIDVSDGILGCASVIQTLSIEKKYICISDNRHIECTYHPVDAERRIPRHEFVPEDFSVLVIVQE